MDFQIRADSKITAREISLPAPLRLEMGLIIGQFLELKTNGQARVLQITGQAEPNQETALVSPDVLAIFEGPDIDYKILDVTLGCDPEFFVMWGDRRVCASTYLPFTGQIGCDGELGELRPTYTRHENDLVANIAKLVPQIPGRMKRASWATGFPENGKGFRYEAHSYYLRIAAGFHVHLGIPPEILNTRKDFNRAAMNHIVQCLDWHVGVPLVPLEVSHGRRLGNTQYGKPGDYRPSNVTLEYRVPGAFYLRSPQLTQGLLGMSLLVVEHIVSKMRVASRDFVNLHKLTPADLQEVMPIPAPKRILATLTGEDTILARREIDSIRKGLEALPNYRKHQRAVQGLFSAVEEQVQPSPDLLTNWKEST